MNILHITTAGEFSILGARDPKDDFGGGVTKNMLECARYARNNDHYKSYIVCVNECGFVQQAKEYGFTVNVISSFWIKLFGRPITVWINVKHLKEIIRKYKIDVVHAYNFAAGLSGGIAAKQCRVPMVTSVHQDISDYVTTSNNIIIKILSFLRKSIILSLWRWGTAPLSNKILPVSNSVGDEVKQIGINHQKIQTVYNGLDFEKLMQQEDAIAGIRKEFNITHNDYLIGSVGRLSPVKGYEYLIRTVYEIKKNHSNVKLILIGEGEKRVELESLIKKLNMENDMFLPGFRMDVNKCIKEFDCFVLPSLMEGMPTVLLEAMYAKVPVVATAVSGTPEIVKDLKTGRLVSPKDVADLKEKIEYVLTSHSQVKEMVAAAYEMTVNHFSLDKKVATLAQIYSTAKGNQ